MLASAACKLRSEGDTSDFEEVQTARMPIIPAVSHKAKKSGGPALPVGQLTAEEEAAVEESMKVYLKPVNYYTILQDRDKDKPLFLARSLRYKPKEKLTKKVQLSVFISEAIGDKIHTQTIFPVYILLARQDPTPNGETLRSSSYHYKKAIKLTSSDATQAKFTLPEIKKLSVEVKDRSVSILLVSSACVTAYAGECVMGKIPIDDFLHRTCETSKLSLGERLQSISTVSMQSCHMKATFPNVITFQFPYNSKSVQVPVVVTAEEAGAKAIDNNNSVLPPGLGLNTGEVTFKYKGYNDIVCETDVTPDYSCAFCLLACASYKGLKCHLQASHDLFDYEFQEDEKYQLVNVSYNKSDVLISENFGILAGDDKEFFFCHKALKRTKIEKDQTQLADHVGHVTLYSVTHLATINSDFRGPNAAGVPVEPSDPANQILQNQQFFHSCRSQPLALQEVVVGDGNEDEADDAVTDLEDQRGGGGGGSCTYILGM